MHLPFSLFLALKYLKPKRTFMSVVSIFSVLGVLLGVMVMVVVISVMSGFDDMWREKILGFNAHIVVSRFGVLENPAETMAAIRNVPGVTGAAPFVQGLIFLQHDNRVYTPLVKGVDPGLEKTISRVPEHMVQGHFALDDESIVMGQDLARRMNVTVGDTVLVYSPQNFASPDELHLPDEFTVTGLFELGMWDFDMGYVLTSLDTARDLYHLNEGVHGIEVMTDNPYHAGAVAERLREALGPTYQVKTWMDMNRTLFAALRVEKNLMFFLLIFIVIVAAFGITNTLITSTYQKTREIGLLKALGFSSGGIMRVFIWQGWVVGLFGTVSGILLGLLVLQYRNDLLRFLSERFHLELLPKSLYQLSEIPAHTSASDLLIIALSALAICTLAGLVPARRAAKLDPVQALRYE